MTALTPLWLHFAGTDAIPLASAFAAIERQPLGFWTSLLPGAVHARQLVWLYALLPLALIGPPTFLMGLSFPYLQKAVQTDARFLGRRVGWLQTANIAGSLLGSLGTGFLLLPQLGTAGRIGQASGSSRSDNGPSPVHRPNQLYDTSLQMFALEGPGERATRQVQEIIGDARFTQLEPNLLYYERLYREALAHGQRGSWLPESPEDRELRARYDAYLEAQREEVRELLSRLYAP